MLKAEKSLEKRLNAAHPALKKQILSLLELSESGIENADAVEELAIEGTRSLGREVLQGWAQGQVKDKSEKVRQGDAPVTSHGKKNSIGQAPSEK